DRQRRLERETDDEVDEQADRQPAQHDLSEAETENVPAQPPQPARLKLEPDDEQQQRDADLGHAGQLLGVADQPERFRPDQRAGDDVAERRAELEAAEQRDEDQRGAEHDRAAFEDGSRGLRGLRRGRHSASSIAAASARNGRRIAPWRDLRDRAGASAARPQPGSISPPPSQSVRPASACSTSMRERPIAARSTSAADAWPKAQAWTCCDTAATRPRASSCTAVAARLPQVGERSSARPSARSSSRGSPSEAASRRISVV